MVYGYMNGIYSSRKLEKACHKNIDYMWLLENRPVPDHNTFSRFRSGRLAEVVEDLFYQYVRRLEAMGETDHEAGFIDGTKLESAANRYTFVWRKTTEKHLAKVKEQLGGAFETHMEKEEPTPESLRRLLTSQAEEISFVHGTGKRKTPRQREWEKRDALLNKWEEYEAKLTVMGKTRNSYSKTDPDATFMRMKEDHMGNGRLKPGYNVQIAVNSEYITGVGVYSNRSDSGTLIPFLKTLERGHHVRYHKVVADAGYRTSGCAERKVVFYDYKETRKQEYPREFLKDFKGCLRTDGYQVYHNLPPGIVVVGYWAHVRRKWENLLKTIPKEKREGYNAAKGVAYLNALFALEREFAELSPKKRFRARLNKNKPVCDAFFAWAVGLGALPKVPIGEAVGYMFSQRKYLENFFLDGRLELSNNRAERSVKPFVLGRKNWLFSGIPAGARASSVL